MLAGWISVALPGAPATGLRAPLKARSFRNKVRGDSKQRVPPQRGPLPIRVAGLKFLEKAARRKQSNFPTLFRDVETSLLQTLEPLLGTCPTGRVCSG